MFLRPIKMPCRQVFRTLATKTPPIKELSFSKSGAYFGKDQKSKNTKSIYESNTPLYIPSYFDSQKFQNKRLLMIVFSLGCLFIYFGILRETNDIDIILNTPPHILSGNLERRMLREQISDAKQAGRSAELLEAQLEYVEVKEAAIKAQYAKKSSR